MTLQKWVKLPTEWITKAHKLKELRWTSTSGEGANNIAALVVLIVIAHHADEAGLSILTYDQLSGFTGLSRAKISGGLRILEKLKIIGRHASGRSAFQLVGYDPTKGWGKLPAKGLYSSNRVAFFSTMSLRKASELHALKIYLLLIAMRDNQTNLARISYDGIDDYTGVDRHQIRTALSILAANGVVHIEHTPTWTGLGVANAYRIAFIDDRKHMGTTMRGYDFRDETQLTADPSA